MKGLLDRSERRKVTAFVDLLGYYSMELDASFEDDPEGRETVICCLDDLIQDVEDLKKEIEK